MGFSSFGVLKIMAGQKTWLVPNQYVVMAFDGDSTTAPSLVEGELAVNITLPIHVVSANASIVQQSGLPFSRLATGSSALPQYVSGGMPPCNLIGPSPTPCQQGVYLSVADLANIDLLTTLQLPTNATYYWNRNSPFPAIRPIFQLTQLCFTQTGAKGCFEDKALETSFQFPYYDLDGNTLYSYIDGTTLDGPGTQTLFCATGRILTLDGCNGPDSALDAPPYTAPTFGFNESFTHSTPSNNAKFYYSISLKVWDGTNLVTQELQINLCQPLLLVQSGTGTALGRAPEFVTLGPGGTVLRQTPPTTVQCRRSARCAFTVSAATFADVIGTAPATKVVTRIVLTGYNSGGQVFNQSINASSGVTTVLFLAGDPGANGTHPVTQIGRYWVPCFYAVSNTACRSAPLCFLVKILGSDPVFLPPTPPMVKPGDDVQPGVVTITPVCDGLTVSFGLRATDPDPDDSLTLDVTDSTGDGQNLFGPPFNAELEVNTTNPHVPSALFSYTLDYATGVQQDPVTRAVEFPADRLICVVAVDNTWRLRKRFGELPDGNFRSPTKCYAISFAGPPAFITTASRLDATPFAALNGDVAARTRTLDFFYGVPRTVTFRARSPISTRIVTVFILEDPGIPDGATVSDSVCNPPADGNGNCSVASRSISWTPPAGLDFARVYRVCAVPRDNVVLPQCPTDQMTVWGWYGEEQCVAIRLVPPSLAWTRNSSIGTQSQNAMVPTLHAFVPCATIFLVEAMDNSTAVNANGTLSLSPYNIAITFASPAPTRAVLRAVVTGGRLAVSELVYTAARGDEGRRDTVCLTAGDAAGAILSLPAACVVVMVRRCIYCLSGGDTLQSIMLAVAGDVNWLRLWAANGNDDEDPDTTTVTVPENLGGGSSGQTKINLGALYAVEPGDTLVGLAARFQTTVQMLLSLNPDVAAAAATLAFGRKDTVELAVGQELCVVPCSGLEWDDQIHQNAVAV